MHSLRLPLSHLLLITLPVALIYGPYLDNPFVFDDLGFFLTDQVLNPTYETLHVHPRWLPYFTLSKVSAVWGVEPFANRIVSLVLHLGVAWSIYLFSRLLLTGTLAGRYTDQQIAWTAFSAALLFALHPAAVYGAAYLIQRTILFATLFSILTWYATLKGVMGSKPRKWLVLAGIFYFFAVFSKQHAVTTIGPAVVFTFLAIRFDGSSNSIRQSFRRLIYRLRWLIPAWIAIAIYVIYLNKMYIGVVYEPHATGGLGAIDLSNLEVNYPLSLITQTSLYFKYLFLWLVPVIRWMSVDMRESFAQSLLDWPYLPGAVAFVGYAVACSAIIFFSRNRFIVTAAALLLAPWLMFLVELSTIRVQEIFVLYRSYLWMPSATLLIPVIFLTTIKTRRLFSAAHFLLLVSLVPMTIDRLTTFSNPYLLWEDAARLVQGKSTTHGIERPLFLSAYYLHRQGFAEPAKDQFDKLIEHTDNYAPAFKGRGMALLDLSEFEAAIADFDKALALKPDYHLAFYGKGLTYMAQGDLENANRYFSKACDLKLPQACHTLKTGVPIR